MRLFPIVTALCLALGGSPASAQSQFSPVITVNDAAITGYELDQRRRLLELFRTPGDLDALARTQLIEDRLKQAELDRAGVALTPEGLQGALDEFAGRANLTLDQFTTVLAQNGVDRATLEAFVGIGVTWRDYIRSRYGRAVEITETDIDRVLNQPGSAAGIEVLLSEIIIAAPPPQAAAAQATAERIARLTSQAAFEAEARRVSALPSRANGGRLGWLPITNYPPQLQSLILSLSPGEVTAPINIPNGVALFQMRGVREVSAPQAAPTAIDYAAFYLAGGPAAARQLADRVDTCDDLYGAAQGQPAEVLDRLTQAPGEIPADVALELARLDPGEVSTNLTRNGGETVVFLMLCGRSFAADGAVDREAVANQLRSQRLAGFADALLAELRAAATIRP